MTAGTDLWLTTMSRLRGRKRIFPASTNNFSHSRKRRQSPYNPSTTCTVFARELCNPVGKNRQLFFPPYHRISFRLNVSTVFRKLAKWFAVPHCVFLLVASLPLKLTQQLAHLLICTPVYIRSQHPLCPPTPLCPAVSDLYFHSGLLTANEEQESTWGSANRCSDLSYVTCSYLRVTDRELCWLHRVHHIRDITVWRRDSWTTRSTFQPSEMVMSFVTVVTVRTDLRHKK